MRCQQNVSANGYTGLGMQSSEEMVVTHRSVNVYALDMNDVESPGTPRLQTPRGGMVMDPDAILHSLREKTKHRRKASKSSSKGRAVMKGRKPSSPLSQKLPKPKTKGQWL